MTVERLESRIAPAGVVKITLTPSDILISGDEASNIITEVSFPALLDASSPGSILRIESAAGTQLEFNGVTANSVDVPLGARKNLIIDLGGGDDALSLSEIDLDGTLMIKGGPGANTVTMNGRIEAGRSLSYSGGDDADTLTGMMTSIAAPSILVDLKGGANSCKWEQSELDASKNLTIRGGSGDDEVELSGQVAAIGKLTVNLGAGTNTFSMSKNDVAMESVEVFSSGAGDSFALHATERLEIRKGLTATMSGGSGRLEIGAGETLRLGGANTLTCNISEANALWQFLLGGENFISGSLAVKSNVPLDFVLSGFDPATGVDANNPARTIHFGGSVALQASDVLINSTAAIAVRGAFSLTGIHPIGNAVSNIWIGSSFAHFGAGFKFQGVATDTQFSLLAGRIDINGKFSIAYNLGDTATHEVGHYIGVPGGLFTAGSVDIVNPSGSFNLSVNGGVDTAGAFKITDGAGASDIEFNGSSLRFGSGAKFSLGTGASTTMMEGGSLRSSGSVVFEKGVSPDLDVLGWVYLKIEILEFKVRSGGGASALSFDADTGRIGSMLIDLGTGANVADLRSTDGLRIGKLGILSKSGESAPLERVSLDGLRLRDATVALGNADSTLNIARVFAGRGKLTASLGGGDDRFTMDDSLLLGETTVLTGDGADEFSIETDGLSGGYFRASGKFTVNLGAGDDSMVVANADVTSKAVFAGPFKVDGGDGADVYTAHPTNSSVGIIAILIGL